MCSYKTSFVYLSIFDKINASHEQLPFENLGSRDATALLDALATSVAAPGDPERDCVLRWLRNSQPKTLADVALCALWHNKGLVLMRRSGDDEAEHISISPCKTPVGPTSASVPSTGSCASTEVDDIDFERELANITLDDTPLQPQP